MWTLIVVTITGNFAATAMNLDDCRRMLWSMPHYQNVQSAVCRSLSGDEVVLVPDDHH